MDNRVIGLWYNLSRVVEIAKAGNFTVNVCLSPEYENGFDDYKTIKDFYKGFFEGFVSDGDLIVTIDKPDNYNIKYKPESKNDIQRRIDKGLKCIITDTTISTASQKLLERATDKLSLSFDCVEKVKKIALVIAKLSYAKQINIEHVAEAIQYRAREDKAINAEDESVNFGTKIRIKYGEVNPLDAKEAIAYLGQFV